MFWTAPALPQTERVESSGFQLVRRRIKHDDKLDPPGVRHGATKLVDTYDMLCI